MSNNNLVNREDVISICQAHRFNTYQLMSNPPQSDAARMIRIDVEALSCVSSEISPRINIHLSEILEQLDINEKYFSGVQLFVLQNLQQHIRDSVAEIRKLVG